MDSSSIVHNSLRRLISWLPILILLGGDDPRKVVSCPADFIIEAKIYSERFGLVILRFIFSSAFVVVDKTLLVYYGCTEAATSFATAPLAEVFKALRVGAA